MLIFEDDAIINWHLQSSLGALGLVHSDIHESLSQATVAIYSKPSDIIFLNLKLEDGWVQESFILECLKQTELLVILTGYSDFKSVLIEEHEKIRVLIKPFNQYQLKQVLFNNISQDG